MRVTGLGVRAQWPVWTLCCALIIACGEPADPFQCVPLTQPLPALAADEPDRAIAEPEDDAAFWFGQYVLHTVELLIEPDDLAILNAAPADEVYVPGYVVFNGVTYGPVGVRYKGSIGSFVGCTSGPDGFWDISGPKTCPDLNFKVSFNRYDPELRFFGLKKLLFHAMRQDPSLMRERLGYWLFRQMGVPAPRANHIELALNGEYLGAYLNVEYLDGRFADVHFDDGDGHLYKETWPTRRVLGASGSGESSTIEAISEEALFDGLRTHEDDEGVSVDRLRRFALAMVQSDPDAKARATQLWMSIEHAMRFLVTDRFIGADDGPCHFYCFGGEVCENHNVYLYTEENADRVWFIPWDLDNAFITSSGEMTAADRFLKIVYDWNDDSAPCEAVSGAGSDALDQMPPSCDPLLNGLGCHFNDAYVAQANHGLSGPFSAEVIDGALEAWSAQISEAVKGGHETNSERLSVSEWEANVSDLKGRITRLREALLDSVSGAEPGVTPTASSGAWPELIINEVSPVGEVDDWVELFNPTEGEVDLGGWYITDDNPVHMRIFRPGRTISPGQYLVIHRGAPDHFGFGLGKNDGVALYGPDSVLVDSTSWTKDDLESGESWGRVAAGAEGFISFSVPTPGAVNGSN